MGRSQNNFQIAIQLLFLSTQNCYKGMTFNAFSRRLCRAFTVLRPSTKTLRVMQLTAIILLGCCLHLSAATLSQIITFTGKDVRLESVLSEVKKQTGYNTLVDVFTLEKAKPVTIDANDLPLVDFLNEVFAHQPLTFSIKTNSIIITRKKDASIRRLKSAA